MLGEEKRRDKTRQKREKGKKKRKEGKRKIFRLGKLRKLGRKGGGDVDVEEKKKGSRHGHIERGKMMQNQLDTYLT